MDNMHILLRKYIYVGGVGVVNKGNYSRLYCTWFVNGFAWVTGWEVDQMMPKML